MLPSLCRSSMLCFAVALLAAPAFGLVLNQVDTFQDGTTEGWQINLLGMGGGVPQPTVQPTGGPAGAGDAFMLLTSNGLEGAGGRLTALNVTDWAGSFLGVGVGAVSMDVINLGPTEIHLRLLFENAVGGPPLHTAFSSDPIIVAPGSGWQSIVFPVSLDDLTAGTGDVVGALANTTVFRIYSSPTAVFPGPPIAALVGIDNIRALAPAVEVIPEPATAALFGVGLLAWMSRRKRVG